MKVDKTPNKMSGEEFEKRYKSLNQSQKKAVDTIEGPVMVIAGPGTGKTTILTLRIANILKRTDTPPSGILALTFTDAGVKAIRVKLREIIGSREGEIRVHTFHSFAGSVMSEFPEHFAHIHRSTQTTDIEAESLVREILKDKKFSRLRPLGDTDFYLHRIIGAISDSKKEAWSPTVVREFAKVEIERIKSDPDALSTRGVTKGSLKAESLKQIERGEKTLLFADVYERYEAKKLEDRKMDYDDLLLELLKTLKEDELLLRLLQEKFLYILLDEHQDTNDVQNEIVALLASFFENPNIFVVGDEKQAIYRFQGASVENFLRFQNIWKEMKVIHLSDNYRSHQSILDSSFSMIEENYEEGQYTNLRVRLKSGSKQKQKPIDLVFAPNSYSADMYVVRELQRISKYEPDATVSVIMRWNKDVSYMLSLCEAHSISVSAERGADIFSHPLGVLYFKLLEYVNDPSQTESLAETIAGGLWSLDFDRSNILIKKIRSGNILNIEKEIPELATLKKERSSVGVIDYLIMLGTLSGLTRDEMLSNPLSVEVWRGIIDLAKSIAHSKGIEDSQTLIKELLNYKKSSEKKSIKIGSGASDSKIQIMTAHSSKGLEYDYVFIPYALEEYWMRRPRSAMFALPREKDTSDEIKDSRRLFYVAITRAKKHVSIIVPQTDDLGRDFTPLRFLGELESAHTKRVDTEKSKDLPKVMVGSTLATHRKKELHEYAKRIISENGLSVTALNHFIKCPSDFLYKSILKIPEPPTGSSEKGIAMHKAIAEVWKSSDKSVSGITKTIKEVVKTYFSSSLLPLSEKEIILEELLLSAPIVSTALQEHFNTSGTVSTERWLEKTFESMYKKQPMRLTLHGQMDALLDTKEKIYVFDYKTREAMSVNAIKGETKDSDGNYFRQLVFYKILLDKNSIFTEKEIEPALVFVKPDQKGRCPIITLPITREDIERVEKEIHTLLESVYSGDFLNYYCEDTECKSCLMKRFNISSSL